MSVLLGCLFLLKDIRRKVDNIVDLGAGPGHFSKLLDPENARKVIMLDISRMQTVSNFYPNISLVTREVSG